MSTVFNLFVFTFTWFPIIYIHDFYTVKKKKLGKLKILSQPASADFWVFSTSYFKIIKQNIKQKVEKFPKK